MGIKPDIAQKEVIARTITTGMGTKLVTAQKVATLRITMIEMDIKLATAKQAETQSIIMTKDVDIDSDNYNDFISQPNVSKIYLLESELYREEGVETTLYEVSTKVSQKK